MYNKALHIDATKEVCDDESLPMNYEPFASEVVEDLDEMAVDEDALHDVDVDVMPENEQEVTYRHEAAVDTDESDHSSQSNDLGVDRILMNADAALGLAIKTLQKAPTSTAFSVEIEPTKTVDHLKNLIKAKKSPEFDTIAADKLTLWRVSISVVPANKHKPVVLDQFLEAATELDPTDDVADVFSEKPPKKTIHIIVQRPSSDAMHPEVAALRKQLSELEKFQADVQDSSITLGIVVKPEKKVAFSWSAMVETATLDDLKKNIFVLYPQYAHDEYLEVFVYNGQPKPEPVRDNDDLRKILMISKATLKSKLTISLETPTKNFSAWTFKDVCDEYNLSASADPGFEVLPPFPDIQSILLDSDFEKATQDRLINEIESRVDVLNLFGANEATKSMLVESFMVAATKLFKDDLYLTSQRNLSGRRGNGPVDFSVHSRTTHDYTLGVTEVKRDDFKQGVAQNLVQLESALTQRKRKRETSDVDGDEEPRKKQRAYGIVTDSAEWAFLECTLHEDETVTYRMSKLKEKLNYDDKWQEDAKSVLGKIVWLWSRMRDEISVRDSNARKMSSPSNKRASL
ncbi:hypothetical protein EC957_010882 [Mortierella hygrophila]|uniref:Crinkler effector protein N-terminal domain-containing protein n=1 Tax=Mortierella hygrophila TaxID=979708 RepID=A0A9P6JXL7_9FUNG|nr:hypothetical protein EC957_010882 [Mortierella hygrophila]